MKHSSLSGPHASGARRTSPIPMTLALSAIAFVAACESPQPPVVCAALEDQTMFVRQDRFVTPCFQDPEMGEITLSAQSSDAEVVTTTVVAHGVSLEAIAVGNVTITVTATDPDQLTASVSFTVEVPNRPPWRRGRMPDVHLFSGGRSFQTVSRYFVDPDGQDLTYSATSSNTVVLSASLAGQSLTMNARREGAATLTLTATDPFGDTVSQEAAVNVWVPADIFRDDFETEASLSDWELGDNSDAMIAEGKLWLHNVVVGLLGVAGREVEAVPWKVTAAMGNSNDSVFAALLAEVDHPRYNAYLIQIGLENVFFPDFGPTNYRFYVWDAERRNWTVSDGWYGESSEIADVGELTEITMSAQGGELTVHAGSARLVRVDLEAAGLSGRLTFLALATWAKPGEAGHAGIFDWVDLKGISPASSLEEGAGSRAGRVQRLSRFRFEDALVTDAVGIVKMDKPVLRPSQRRR